MGTPCLPWHRSMRVIYAGKNPCVVYILGAQDDEAGSWFVGIQLIKLILVTTDRYIYNQH
jgi:hypothetical protein